MHIKDSISTTACELVHLVSDHHQNLLSLFWQSAISRSHSAITSVSLNILPTLTDIPTDRERPETGAFTCALILTISVRTCCKENKIMHYRLQIQWTTKADSFENSNTLNCYYMYVYNYAGCVLQLCSYLSIFYFAHTTFIWSLVHHHYSVLKKCTCLVLRIHVACRCPWVPTTPKTMSSHW